MDAAESWEDPRLRALLDQLCAAARLDPRMQSRADRDDLRSKVCLKLAETPLLVGKPQPVWENYLRKVFESVFIDFLRWERAGKRDFGLEVREGQLAGGDSSGSTPGLGGVLAGPDTTPSQKAVKNEELDRLEAAIRRLPPDQQRAIRLHLERRGPTEIAAEMGKTADAVTSLIRRATLALTNDLTDTG